MRGLMFFALMLISSLLPGQQVTLGKWEQLIPAASTPAQLKVLPANNNLDVTFFDGRFYVAFRTAPTHFASKRTRIHVMSSTDRLTWDVETSIFMGSDMREPRFAALDGKLFFYFFQGGTNPLGFEPKHVFAMQRLGDQQWGAMHDTGLDGYVPWRIRPHQGRLYMSAYDGRGLYTDGHQADLRLFVSTDGLNWDRLSTHAQVSGKGGEEGEFIFDEAGNLWGTVRMEGAGAYLVYADKDSLDRWRVFPTRDKYDSALLFRAGKDIYLVSRRNLDGASDKGKKLSSKWARLYNLARYSVTKKTTAIWRIDQENKKIVHVRDIGGTGDTAFPGIVEYAPGKWWLLNYSSDMQGRPKTWINGQIGRTFIYATELRVK